jgi:drug/metabolite transporter (DMT)-like permease
VPVLSAYEWLVLIGFLGVIGGALGFFLWTWAVGQTTPTRTAVFLTLNPTTAALLGAVLLGERITMPFMIGLTLVLAGIIVANLQLRGSYQALVGWGARG